MKTIILSSALETLALDAMAVVALVEEGDRMIVGFRDIIKA